MRGGQHAAQAARGTPAPEGGSGRYVLIRRLAHGGMADVYLARDKGDGETGIERLVAVKRILPHMARDARFVSMVLDEARISNTLTHPAIAQTLDVGDADGHPYLVIEYLHGKTLRELLKDADDRGMPLPLGCAIGIVAAACAGLHYAHESRDMTGKPLGLVHRDVSPSNLMVRYDGSVKILDFGVAATAGKTAPPGIARFAGKSGYMSPEQAAGLPLDRRSDVFSVGILLYEASTGRRLFAAETPIAAANKIVQGRVVAPSSWLKGYPRALERIVFSALASDLSTRYQTCEELQIALESFAREQQLDSSSIRLRRYMTGLYGNVPYPSVSAAPIRPPPVKPGLSMSADEGQSAPVDRNEPGHVDTEPRPPHPGQATSSTTVWGVPRVALIAAGLVMAAGGVLAAAAMRTSPPASTELGPTPTAGAVGPTDALVWSVNEPDWDLALGYVERHAALTELRNAGGANQIDDPLHIALDLLQASDAPDPCAVFSNALAQVEAAPLDYFLPALLIARPPTGTAPGCDRLAARLSAAREVASQRQRRSGPAAEAPSR